MATETGRWHAVSVSGGRSLLTGALEQAAVPGGCRELQSGGGGRGASVAGPGKAVAATQCIGRLEVGLSSANSDRVRPVPFRSGGGDAGSFPPGEGVPDNRKLERLPIHDDTEAVGRAMEKRHGVVGSRVVHQDVHAPAPGQGLMLLLAEEPHPAVAARPHRGARPDEGEGDIGDHAALDARAYRSMIAR